ncbi:MAG: O-antigen ligase family protein [Chloroflexota bacterium]
MFLGQAMLTFSRGGVYSFVLGFVVLGLHTLNTPRNRGRFLLLVIVGTVLLVFVIFPWLNNYTGGALAARLAELDTTGRLAAAEADVQAFTDYPLTGVGVGMATEYRTGITSSSLAAHTEYTRLLAEHGLFGIGALLILGWMLLKRYAANAPGLSRGFVAAFAVWSLSIMVHSAMRIEVIPFALAISFMTWKLQRVEEPLPEGMLTVATPSDRALPAGR